MNIYGSSRCVEVDRIRVAIPADNDDIKEAHVFEHFGRAPYYLIIEITDNKISSVEAYKNPAIEHSPGTIPEFLKSKGANVIICMGMGRRAQMFFAEYGIEIVTGASGKVSDIISSFIRGELKSRPYQPREKWKNFSTS